MPDRDKVIELLKEIADYFEECRQNASFGSKAEEHFYELRSAASDAIKLLKEQEPQAVKIQKNAYNHEFYYCPRCDRGFEGFFRKPMFCDKCGQAVKWDAAD